MTLQDIYGFGSSAPHNQSEASTKRPRRIVTTKSTLKFTDLESPVLPREKHKRGTYRTPLSPEFSMRTHCIGAISPPPVPETKNVKKLFSKIPGGTGENMYQVMNWL
eukprot:NODE_151_length_17042_cov_0.275925.p10 type:complete len:107 gc:universal NODE_151_length_17042_cov_0.275925:9139-9459(+)